MTQTLDEVQKQFTILYKDAYPTQIMYPPSGGKIFVPRIQQTTVQCSPELVCHAPLTALSDTNPHHGFMTWFRLRDIPNTMNKLKFPIAAQLANKWFEGEPYEMNGKEKAGQELYPEHLIDTTTVTMNWLQTYFPRVNPKILLLRDVKYLSSKGAKKSLHKNLKRAGLLDGSSHTVAPWTGVLSREFHKDWQFQFISVDVALEEQFFRGLSGPDDLYAALGGFSFNAAIAELTVNPLGGTRFEVIIPQIIVYARDTYDFNDEEGHIGSQYLGHWNDDDLDITLGAYISTKLDYEDNDSPLIHYFGDKPTPKNTYFCVRNKHFRAWREKHHAGGDLLIFSNGLQMAPMTLSPALPGKLDADGTFTYLNPMSNMSGVQGIDTPLKLVLDSADYPDIKEE